MKSRKHMGKRVSTFVKNEILRWNLKDSVPKQCMDLLEQMRVFLESIDHISVLEYARAIYLRNATISPEVAKDYAAINSEASLFAFLIKYEDDTPDLTLADIAEMEKQGLPNEMLDQARELLKDKKERQC